MYAGNMEKIVFFLLIPLLLLGAGCNSQQKIIDEQQKKIDELTTKVGTLLNQQATSTVKVETTKVNVVVPTIKKTLLQSSVISQDNNRIKDQLIFFENLLESNMIDTYLKCDALAVYNNVLITESDQKMVKAAFPEPHSTYQEACGQQIVALRPYVSRLIAEPELVNLRQKMTLFINTANALAMFALDGGYDASTQDTYHKELKSLLTDSREEIIRIKREYSIDY